MRSTSVKERARALGFEACGIATAGPADPENRLGQWIGAGFHADMAWLARTRDLRQDVTRKLPGTRSVIVVARNYYQPNPPRPKEAHGKVARYAWGRDYHKVLKKPLRQLAAFVDGLEEGATSYACVDSGPVLERTWAERAGVGWVGKNSLILRRDLGSWFFLGVVLSTVELAHDTPGENRCGSCHACIDACPTGAIVAPGVVDARRCIAYQTIENRGDIPRVLHGPMDGWVFGCDICQEVCPWNRFATPTDEPDFAVREGVAYPVLDELCALGETAFNTRFEGTPVRRAKHAGMVRNAKIARESAGE